MTQCNKWKQLLPRRVFTHDAAAVALCKQWKLFHFSCCARLRALCGRGVRCHIGCVCVLCEDAEATKALFFTTENKKLHLYCCFVSSVISFVCSKKKMFPCANARVISYVLFRPNPHWTRARKSEHKSFHVACMQCGHPHSHQHFPFALCRVARPVWMRP